MPDAVSPRLNQVVPVLPVRDLGAALSHYAALGFEMQSYDDTYAFAQRDGVQLHLTAVADLNPATSNVAAYLYVDDADALHAEWQQANVGGRLHPPEDTPYGLREGAHVDPDGNLVRFGAPLAMSFDPATLPQKRVGAGVLLRDVRGAVLLVKPTYKDGWEIPGGLVEAGESPREAARRECQEELGIDLDLGAPVCIHYAEGLRTPGDGVMFVFDAATTSVDAADLALPPDELEAARFVAFDELSSCLPPLMVARMQAAIEGANSGTTVYLER